MPEGLHLDAEWRQRAKDGEGAAGDTVVVRRIPEEGRLVAILADGLGSGIKAAVLSGLTAVIAARHTAAGRDLQRTAALLARTLPVCSQRGIGYSTFTILDLQDDGAVRIVNRGNPPSILVRDGGAARCPAEIVDLGDDGTLRMASFRLAEDDRLVVVSDGVTQAGMGRTSLPFGWGEDGVHAALAEAIATNRGLAAGPLAGLVVEAACAIDDGRARDDATCLVVHLRRPRRLLLVTGPPYDETQDALVAAWVSDAPGRVAVCGGTTTRIIARELHRAIGPGPADQDPSIPPGASLRGVDLVTEGMITLAACLRLLEGPRPWPVPLSAATRLADLLLDSDRIDMVVGTRINEAHQDPALPMELGIRRNLLRSLAAVLERRWARRVTLRFV